MTQFEEFFVPEKAQNGIGKKIFAYDRHFLMTLTLSCKGYAWRKKCVAFNWSWIFRENDRLWEVSNFHCFCTWARILNGKMICSNYDRIKRVSPSASNTKENRLSSSSLRVLFEDALLSRLKDKLGSATYNPYLHELLMGVLSCKRCPWLKRR